MAFKAVENDGGLMKKGDYEVYVKSCGYATTRNEVECIAFDFVVRADVEQEYQNKHLFKNFYKNRETGEYDVAKLGKYANALGIEKGQDFELDDLIGRNCIVHISHFTGDDGVTRECIYYVATSKVTPYIGEAPDGSDIIPDEELNDDPLPF